MSLLGRPDTEHNGNQLNDIQRIEDQHYDNQNNNK
jgi:hypothetical protein